MAKKSKKRLCRHEKERAGGKWSLFNIFDFRSVRSSQKPVIDKKHGCRRSEGEKHGSAVSESAKETVGDDKGSVKKSHWWTRNAKASIVGTDFVQRPHHRKHKSCSSVGLKPNGDSFVEENQLVEAAKVLAKHFSDGKRDWKIQPSKELTDALDILDANKELYLKLTRDPNSQLVERRQILTDLLEQDIGSDEKSESCWRRFRSRDRNALQKITIAVQKPGAPNSTDEDHIEKLKRKLKNGSHRRYSAEQLNLAIQAKKVGEENVAVASPNIERKPKSSGSFQKVDNIEKLKDDKVHLEKEHGLTPEQTVSNTYAECQTSDDNSSSRMQEIIVNVPHHVKQEPESDAVPSSEDTVRALDAASHREANFLEISVESYSLSNIMMTEEVQSPTFSLENSLSSSSDHNTNDENQHSSYPDSSTNNTSLSDKTKNLDALSEAANRLSPTSVLESVFKQDDTIPPDVNRFTAIEPVRPQQIKCEEVIFATPGRMPSNRTSVEYDKYTFTFVKDVIEMSGLTWDELLKRSLLSNHLIDPSLIDKVDFHPDLLLCNFNLLFDLINEILVELCWVNFGSMVSLATPSVHPALKGKDIICEVWRLVNRYLKQDGTLQTVEQVIAEGLQNPGLWNYTRLDHENVEIQIQEAILDELVEDTISSYVTATLDSKVMHARLIEASTIPFRDN